MELKDFQQLATNIRKHIVRAIFNSKASHIASALSISDILAVLYGANLVNPDKPQFFLSKGHAGIAVYATLRELGIISEEIFATYYMNGSILGGHVSHKNVPGVFLSTGSLGGGISVANGVCIANLINQNNDRIFVIVGDGECNEGSIWEAALYAGANNLTSLVVIVDYNRLQGCGYAENILPMGKIADKFKAFNFQVVEIDGHDHLAISNAISQSSGPLCIVAHTIKGKGISFMENNNLWHYKNLDNDTYCQALKELEYLDA